MLGGAAFWNATPDEAAEAFSEALDRGVNHLDIAPTYGVAEQVVGPLVPAVRHRLFIGEKTGRTHPDGIRAQLDTTLERLGTDHVDLYQAHGVTDLDDLDGRDGAFEAILAARDEGSCRFVGVTGHDLGAPRAHAEAVRRYDLDTVMFPVYPRLWADEAYRSDAEALLALAAERDLGIMVIKACAARPWGERTPTSDPWYEPVTEPTEVSRGVRFALSTPGVHAFCTPGDLAVTRRALDAAEAYDPLDDDARAGAVADMATEDHIFPLADMARRR